MPPMKATGRKTDDRISAMATTGPETSRIAWAVAARGARPRSMCCSTASTTTMASSTTRPMASTKANIDSVLIENPSNGNTAKVPMSDTGTAISGMSVARQFDAGHVLHAHDGAVQVGADDDLAKLLRRLEPPLREHRVRLLHALGRRRRAHLARRVDRALLLDRGDEVGHGEPEFGQHIRLHPDAHGVIAGPEQPYLPHARHAVEDVVDVNIGVVREEQ